VRILVHERQVVEVISSFALHCQIDIDKVVSSRQEAYKPSNEENEALDALQVWVAVCNNTSKNQTCSKEDKNCCTSDHFPILPDLWVPIPGFRGWLLSRVVARISREQGS